MAGTEEEYIVVFEYKETAGAYAGCRFRTSFDSEADYKASSPVPELTVVAAGVSEEESLRLCGQASLISQVRATMTDAGFGTEHYDPEYARLVTGFLIADRYAKR
jgi:hypothetical protein